MYISFRYYNAMEELESEGTQFREEVITLQEENTSNRTQLADFQARFEAKLEEVDRLEKKLAANNARNLKKKIQRRDEKIEDLLGKNSKISILEGTIVEMQMKKNCKRGK